MNCGKKHSAESAILKANILNKHISSLIGWSIEMPNAHIRAIVLI
jgi:hypothetical protein